MSEQSNVAMTSRLAYYDHLLSGRMITQRDRVMKLILRAGRPITRNEIEEAFKNHPNGEIKMSRVCGRVDTLIQSDLVRVHHEGPCPVTGNSCQFLEAVK